MNRQDRGGVRSAQDLERKYPLRDLVGIKQALKMQDEGLNKTNTTLEEFMKATLQDLEDLTSQIEGSVTTYFYSGVPTMDNPPTSEWKESEYESHLGDLYYDRDTGTGYRFVVVNGEYRWDLASGDINEVLEIANQAKDTADNKRRVFVVTPKPPYDEGDLWLNNEELYVCVNPKKEGNYNSGDFEKAVKYTDDTALNNFIKGDYADDLKDIGEQIDKKAETWYQDSDPSSAWTTNELKEAHVKDIWYNTTEKTSYIYTPQYTWEETSSPIPQELYDAIDGKAQIFSGTPATPYYINDLYVQGEAGDILVCIKERLEGEYIATDWKKAGKYTDDSALNAFVEDVYTEAIKSLNTQIDGKIATWYASGEPTIASFPAIDWTTDELKESHKGDMYYDKDTGFAYIYDLEDGAYKWSIIKDKDTTEALAIANSAKDTADGKRTVFVHEPSPPYDDGDLWFKDEEIYICQISKGEEEVYVEGDFIIATKYTDDTIANQVGDNLKVLEGTVLTIIENEEQFKAEVYDRDEKTRASIDLINESLKTLITGANGESLMTQTEKGWEFSIESLLNTVDKAVADLETLEGDTQNTIADLNNVKTALEGVSKVTSYMSVYEVDGEPYLELGTSKNGFKSVHTNKGIQFMVGEDVQAYIDYNALNIERAVINEELQIGGFLIKERANGNVGFVWRGEDE